MRASKPLKDIYKENPARNNYSYLDLVHNPFLGRLRDDPRFWEIVEAQKKIYEGLLNKYGDL